MRPHRTRLAALLLGAISLALAGCGGSDGGAAASPLGTPAASGKTVVATADIDGDGRADVLRFSHTGDEPTACWASDERAFFRFRDDWARHPTVQAVRLDASDRSESDLLGDEGIHRARGAVLGARPEPYAVLYVGDAGEEPLGAPEIITLTPGKGDTHTLVGIRGLDLASRDEETAVTFDGIPAEVLVALPRFVLAVVPAGLEVGTVPVVVRRGEESSASQTFDREPDAVPRITAVRPGPLVVGRLAVLGGESLGTPLDDVAVRIGDTDVLRFLPLGARLVFEVPEGATDGDLVVTVNDVPSNRFAVEIAGAAPAPSIDALSPTAASPGSLVRIEGEHLVSFGEPLRIWFGDVEAALFGAGPGHVLAIVPPDATSSDVHVEVGSRASSGLPFDVLARGLPEIVALTPSSSRPGAPIAIEGTDLYDLSAWRPGHVPPLAHPFGDVEVRFGSSRAFLVVPTPEGLRVRVPSQATSGDVTVRVGIDTSNAVPFTVE